MNCRYVLMLLLLLPALSIQAQNYSDTLFDAYKQNSYDKLKHFCVNWQQKQEKKAGLSQLEKASGEVLQAFFSQSVVDSLKLNVNIDKIDGEYWLMFNKVHISRSNKDFGNKNNIPLMFFDRHEEGFLKSADVEVMGLKVLFYNKLFSEAIDNFLNDKYYENDSLKLVNMLPRGERTLRTAFLSEYFCLKKYPEVFEMVFNRTWTAVVLSFNASRYISYTILMLRENETWSFECILSKTIE